MTISILIPTLNEERYIGVLLEALANQTYNDFEVIIVDANSSDRTKEVVQTFSGRLDLSFYQVYERGKIGMQRNLAASKAKGEDLVFFDADVKPGPHFLQALQDSVDAQELDFATCWNNPMSERAFDRVLFFMFNAFYLSSMQHLSPGAVGTFLFVKKYAFEAIHGFDEYVVFGEDFDFTRRLGHAGYKFALVKQLRIPFSVRRLDKDGRLNFVLKMIKGGSYYHLIGSIKSDRVVKHEFGKYV